LSIEELAKRTETADPRTRERARTELMLAKAAIEEASKLKEEALKAAQDAERALIDKQRELERAQRDARVREEELFLEAQNALPDMEQGREFFSMTTAAVLQKLEDQGIIEDARKLTWAFDLFDIAVLEGIPFHEWNDWILERVIQMKRQKDQQAQEQLLREAKQHEMEAKRVALLEAEVLNKTKSKFSQLATQVSQSVNVLTAPVSNGNNDLSPGVSTSGLDVNGMSVASPVPRRPSLRASAGTNAATNLAPMTAPPASAGGFAAVGGTPGGKDEKCVIS